MTLRERLTKNFLFSLVIVYYLGGYFLLNLYTATHGRFYRIALPFEERLPFVPVLIFGYALIFGFLGGAYLLIDDLPFFKRVVRAFLICLTIHFAIFLIFPVEYALRPAVDPDQGWIHHFVSFYYWLDLPYNCFPSLHISNAFLVSFVLDRYHPGLKWVLHPLSILVAISVVLVKQHYILDVVGGYFVARMVFRMVFEPLPAAAGEGSVAISRV